MPSLKTRRTNRPPSVAGEPSRLSDTGSLATMSFNAGVNGSAAVDRSLVTLTGRRTDRPQSVAGESRRPLDFALATISPRRRGVEGPRDVARIDVQGLVQRAAAKFAFGGLGA